MSVVLRYFLSLVAIVFLLVGVFAKRGYIDWRRIVRQNEELELRIEGLKQKKATLEQQIRNLTLDSLHQETVVREGLGYVREGEMIIEFD